MASLRKYYCTILMVAQILSELLEGSQKDIDPIQ